METLARHRNPIFDRRLHTSPAVCVTIDVMHALHLGVLLSYTRVLVWRLIRLGLWVKFSNMDDQIAASIDVIRSGLKIFIKSYNQSHPREKLTSLRFKRKTIGEPDEGPLRTKAQQTWTFLLYLLRTTGARQSMLSDEDRQYVNAGQKLEQMLRLFQTSAVQMSDVEVRSAWQLYIEFCDLTEDVEELLIPKRHLLFHLFEQLPLHGNPRGYASWEDESLNRLLKNCCRGIHQTTFESSVLLRFPAVYNNFMKNR